MPFHSNIDLIDMGKTIHKAYNILNHRLVEQTNTDLKDMLHRHISPHTQNHSSIDLGGKTVAAVVRRPRIYNIHRIQMNYTQPLYAVLRDIHLLWEARDMPVVRQTGLVAIREIVPETARETAADQTDSVSAELPEDYLATAGIVLMHLLY